ncbi:serine hydrolase [Pseudonocardia xishanensis]|uniref:Beta-lactamase-related domain-containing protein n=1 Tax=Pseudonocardia xishanensis TaxID=630995 RepID=A0ABP8S354_9PSEU
MRLVTALTGAVLALAACSTAPAPAATAPDYAAALEPHVTALMAQLQIPGASLYVDVPGRGTWQAALGSTTDQGRPVTVEDHFTIGSVTKTPADPVTKYSSTSFAEAPSAERIAGLIREAVISE